MEESLAMNKKPQTDGGSPARRVIKVVLVLLILGGLPLGSYIYLKMGYDYQVAAMADLKKDVKMPALDGLSTVYGELPDSLMDNMFLVGWLTDPENEVVVSRYGEALRRLHEQFDVPENIYLLTLLPQVDSAWIMQFTETYALRDPAQVVFMTGDPATLRRTADNFGLTDAQRRQLAAHPPLAIVDDSLYVRIAYQVTREEELRRLVEQTAILLPERSREKPRLKRNLEK